VARLSRPTSRPTPDRRLTNWPLGLLQRDRARSRSLIRASPSFPFDPPPEEGRAAAIAREVSKVSIAGVPHRLRACRGRGRRFTVTARGQRAVAPRGPRTRPSPLADENNKTDGSASLYLSLSLSLSLSLPSPRSIPIPVGDKNRCALFNDGPLARPRCKPADAVSPLRFSDKERTNSDERETEREREGKRE